MNLTKRSKKIAAALGYNEASDNAPKVLASGIGLSGEKITELAISNNIPIYKEKKLAEELIKLNTLSEIPPVLYELVAKVLAFIYSLDKEENVK
jgi:FlhB-like protein